MALQFSSQLLDDILFRAGEKVDGTSDYEAQALIYLNRAYRTVYMGGGEFNPKYHENWYWMDENEIGQDTITSVIKTGTVAVTFGSTAITFSVAPAFSVNAYMLRLDDDEDIFHIASHTAGSTAATLRTSYSGATATGKTFRLMKFTYDLPSDLLKISSPIHFYQDGGRVCDQVAMKDIVKFRVSGQDLSGVPDMFAQDEYDRITFNRYGSDTENEDMVYEMQYRPRPADLTNSTTQEPVIPREWRHVLSDLALYFIYFDKNDERTGLVGKQVSALLDAMKMENRAFLAESGSPGHIFPRGRRTVRRVKTSSGKLIGFFR